MDMVILQLRVASVSGGNALTIKSKRVQPLKLYSTAPPSSLLVSNSYPILPALPSAADQSVAAIIFGEGSDENEAGLYPLTKRRSEGAVPLAANYRMIDAVVSNCINSNINKIYALTQFNSTSLNSHLSRAYSGLGILQVIAAYQSPQSHSHSHSGWFQGTADAVRRCLWLVEDYPVVREFLVLPGHHLYRMDYQQLIKAHRSSKADITIAATTQSQSHDPGFGFLQFDSQNQASAFTFKSKDGNWTEFASIRKLRENVGETEPCLRSMGIYLMNKDVMKRLLQQESFPEAKDLASQVIPAAVSSGMKVEAYVFGGYWEDMRSIGAYYRANMESTNKENVGYNYNFSNSQFPLYTLPRCLPPTLIDDAVITDSLIGDGCIIGASCIIKGAVIGMRTRIGDRAIIEDSVIIGSDAYHYHYQAEEEDDDDVERLMRKCWDTNMIPVGIGQQTRIRKAIVDKNARIGKNVMIINRDKVQEGGGETNGYVIRDGIVVVLRSAVIPDGTIL